MSRLLVAGLLTLGLAVQAVMAKETPKKTEVFVGSDGRQYSITVVPELECVDEGVSAKTDTGKETDGWVTVKSEDFEGVFPGEWEVSGNPTWDDETQKYRSGSWGGYCCDGGSRRVTYPGPYPTDFRAWMIYGPFSMSGCDTGYVQFYRWLDCETTHDYLYVGYSTNGTEFHGFSESGRHRSWSRKTLSLEPVAGQSQVWIGFLFNSDVSVTDTGAVLDDILVRKRIPTPRRLMLLSDDSRKSTSQDTWCKLYQSTNYWFAVGVRPSSGDFDIALYADTLFGGSILASSGRTGTDVDFVVADCNHSPDDKWYGVYVDEYSSGSATVEYEDDSDMLSEGSNGPYAWENSDDQYDVVECYDVYLQAGNTYTCTLRTYGSAPDGIALFKSNGSSYYAGRSQAVRDVGVSGGRAIFTYTATSSDYYGIVVYATTAGTGNYYVKIRTGVPPPRRLMLLSDDSRKSTSQDTWCKLYQDENYWYAVGVRSSSGDFDIALYADTLFGGSSLASSGRTSGVDFVVADCNHSPYNKWYGVYVGEYSSGSATVEYENNDDLLTPGNGNGSQTWPAGDVVEIWDKYCAPGYGRPTIWSVDPTSSLDIGVAVFKSNGSAYYAGRSSAYRIADSHGPGGAETVSFYPTTGDYYGFLVWANNSASGTIYYQWTGIEESSESRPVSTHTLLYSCRPGHFRRSTELTYSLGRPCDVRLDVVDASGRLVERMVDARQPQGVHRVRWTGQDASGRYVSPGIYFVRLTTADHTATQKMVKLE